MKRLIAIAAAISLVAPSAMAETLTEAARRSVQAAAKVQAPRPAQTRMKNSGMYVGGIVMSGVGGFMLGRGTATKRETVCVGSFSITYCEEYGANKIAMIGGGAALAGAGIWLATIGGEKVVVSPSLTGISVALRFTK